MFEHLKFISRYEAAFILSPSSFYYDRVCGLDPLPLFDAGHFLICFSCTSSRSTSMLSFICFPQCCLLFVSLNAVFYLFPSMLSFICFPIVISLAVATLTLLCQFIPHTCSNRYNLLFALFYNQCNP